MGTTVQKNFIKEMIKENQFQNVGDIYGYIKDLFKDTIQEMLEAELDVSLGYPKNEKLVETDKNVIVILKRLLRASSESLNWTFPETVKVILNPK